MAALGLGVAACGEDEEEAFKKDFAPLNDKILSLGSEVGRAIRDASGKTDTQLERQFGQFAQRLGALQQDVDELEPPADLRSDQEALVEAMGDVQNDLEGIERAADGNDPRSAASATRDLISDSEDLRNARRALARATGAKLGD